MKKIHSLAMILPLLVLILCSPVMAYEKYDIAIKQVSFFVAGDVSEVTNYKQSRGK